ncbi:MAG TPA: CoA pyrophosphatase [Euzebya sp.]|nr:CoA pyrophosphatase [Euzebya sp.]
MSPTVTVPTTVPILATRIAGHAPRAADTCWAAVAIILTEGLAGPEMLLTRRAARTGDRWSGDMALPGGKYEPSDVSVEATAARETLEETQVTVGPVVGRLDDLEGRPTNHRIATVVFTVDGRPDPVPEPLEVAEAMWLPVTDLADPANRSWHRYQGVVPFPAITVGEHTIWGLTHRVLTHFMAVAGLI